MTALSHHGDDAESERAKREAGPALVEAPGRPTLSVGRIIVGTGVASGAALLGVFIGLPVIVATALGAGIGGSAVAAMVAHASPLRR